MLKYKFRVRFLILIILMAGCCSACKKEIVELQTTDTTSIPTESTMSTAPDTTAESLESIEVLQYMQNGELQDTPAIRYSDPAYSILIPVAGWSMTDENGSLVLCSENEKAACIEISNMGDISLSKAQELFHSSEYDLLEDARGGLSGTDHTGEKYQQISFYPAEEGTYAVRYVFPMAQWEGIGYEIMAVCDSFSLFHPVSIAPEEQFTFPETEETQSTLPSQELQSAEDISNDDFVRIKEYIPSVEEMLYYATSDNFTGQIIYDFNEAYLRYGTVKKLSAASEELGKQGFGLIIWDGFRPVSAQNKLWEVCPDSNFVSSPKGYRAHCRGSAVDVTLYDLETGESVTMPSGFDDFTAAGDRDFTDCTEKQKKNATLLTDVMVRNGFKTINTEWWHFVDTEEYPIEENFYPSASSNWIAECNEFISLRKTPGGKDILARIPVGDKFTLKAWHGKYALVEYQGMEGYVLTSYIRPEVQPKLSTVTFCNPYSYDQMMADLTALSKKNNVSLSAIGKSEFGLNIPVLRIGPENAEYHILIHGGIHGREHMTSWLVTALADYWIAQNMISYPNVCLHVIPMVNPDGVAVSQTGELRDTQKQIYKRDRDQRFTESKESEYASLWKANGLGIDPNRNFPSGWETITSRTGPSAMKFRGSEPLCCSEAAALAAYTESYPFDATVSYHASGSVIYWEYGSKQPVNALSYDLGNQIESVTGYPLVGSKGVDGAGYKDWVMDELGIPSLTIEIGCGDCPLEDREGPSILSRNISVIPTIVKWLKH